MANLVEITVNATAADAKAALDEIKVKLDELGSKVAEARVRLAGDADAQLQLSRINARMIELSHRIADPSIDVQGVARAQAELLGLQAEMDRLGNKSDSLGVRVRGLGSTIASSLGGAAVNALSGLGIAAAGSIGVGMVGALAAAALTLGSFTLVALPSLAKIKTALTATGSAATTAWANLDPAQKAIARNIQGLQKQFDGLAKSMQPLVSQVLALAVKVGSAMIPAIGGLAKAGADVLTGFFNPWLKLLQSPFFASFIKQMSDIAQTWAPRMGQALIGLTKAFMNLFEQAGPAGMKNLDGLVHLLTLLVNNLTPFITWVSKAAVVTGDWLGRNKLLAGTLIAVGAALAIAFGGIGGAVAGVIALIAELTYFWKSSDTFKSAVIRIFADLSHAVIDSMKAMIDVVHGAGDAFFDLEIAALKVLAAVPGPWQAGAKKMLASVTDMRNGFDSAMNGIFAKLDEAQRKFDSTPLVAKLTANISSLQAGINTSLKLLADPNLTKTRQARIEANIAQAQQQIAAIRTALDALNGTTATTYVQTIPIGGGKYIHKASGGIVGAATGGIRSNLVMVGEHGRELVSLPPGSMVHSNPDTERMLAAGGGGDRPLVLQIAPGGSALDELFFTWLRNGIRGRAGGGTNSVQRALGQSS